MTNVVAAIIVTLSTNWTGIGTFTPNVGQPSRVEEGRIATNTIAIIEWKNRRSEIVLESTDGPVIGERKVAIPQITFWYTNTYFTNISLEKAITNYSLLVPYDH